MNRNKLKGTYTAFITPFRDDFSVDYGTLIKLVERQIKSNVEGLIILGTTAESQTLNKKEKLDVILKIQEEVNGKIPLIVGTGSNDTRATIEATLIAQKYNFDGVLVVSPYYNKPTQNGLYRHFRTISEAVDIDIILYNVPSRTNVNILPDTVQKVAEDCSNIIGIKESSGNVEQIMDVINNTPADFIVMCGDDALAVPSIFVGAKGVISVLSNYAPLQFGNCIRAALEGNIAEANKLHYELFDLMKVNFIETSPAPVKAIMKELGLLDNDLVRLPLVPLSTSNLGLIKSMLYNRYVI
ncbi:MAG: 4-hydroxy-tetrahydrodipicolinate synthase [Bacteroidetes bacterium]|nr:4-hydroxy-tetrahydrodipicolinate synthase [Bacteroidota bacterium]